MKPATVPPMSEAQFMTAVMDLLALLGWRTVHFRPAQTYRGWRTPVQGTLGRGWPDIYAVHPYRQRAIFAELKADAGKTTPDQDEVIATLRASGQTVYVWRPRDLGSIQEVLA
jgi:hypothetical protein